MGSARVKELTIKQVRNGWIVTVPPMSVIPPGQPYETYREEKPPWVYRSIEELVGDLPKLLSES